MATATGMEGVWALKQLSSQTGTGSTFSTVAMSHTFAGYFARMPWYLIQTAQNTYDWRAFDALIAAVDASNTTNGTNKKVRFCVMFGMNSPRPPSPPTGFTLGAGWLTTTYPWFQGSASSINDTANQWLPVPWDPLLIAAQQTLITTFCARYKANPTVECFTASGPSTKWQELALPDNVVNQPGWSFTSQSNNVVIATWRTLWATWNAQRGTKRINQMVSAASPTILGGGYSTQVINEGRGVFGPDYSVQWNFLDTRFTSVPTTTTTWAPSGMVGWQAYGLTTDLSRNVTGCDTDTTTGSAQDASAIDTMIRYAWDPGATYVEVYDSDLGLLSTVATGSQPLIANAAQTVSAEMASGVTPPPPPPPTGSLRTDVALGSRGHLADHLILHQEFNNRNGVGLPAALGTGDLSHFSHHTTLKGWFDSNNPSSLGLATVDHERVHRDLHTWVNGLPPTSGTVTPTKLAQPYLPRLSSVQGNGVNGGLTQAQWDTAAKMYYHVHSEGSAGQESLRDSDGTWVPDKFLNSTVAGKRAAKFSIYVNGSYTTQGRLEEKWAAHGERTCPLGLSVWWPNASGTGTGGTLAAGITSSGTTVTAIRTAIALPASAHPNGTPVNVFPFIRSTKSPVGEPYSTDTASYVSWIRIGTEIILLSSSLADFSYDSTSSTITATNVVRGAWGTTAVGHLLGVSVFHPVYIGSSGAAPADAGLAGGPAVNTVGQPLRYGIKFWQDNTSGAMFDGARFIADQCLRELEAREATKAVGAADSSTNTLTVTAHGYVNGNRVALFGEAIPAGLQSHLPYFVINAATNTFQLSLTQGGALVSFTSNAVGDCNVARIYRKGPAATGNTVWLDVSSDFKYNNADPYGRDLGQTLSDAPWDDVLGAEATPLSWTNRQVEKKALLAADLAAFPGLAFSVNNFTTSAAAAANLLDGPLREQTITAMQTPYEWCVLEHWMQESAQMSNELDQLCWAMANNEKVAAWVKESEFSSSVFTATVRGRYIHFCYGAYLLCYRPSATNPQILGKFYPSNVTQMPTDWTTAGETVNRHLFHWDFGTPVTPLAPTGAADLLDATSGLYVRDFTAGLVLVNITATAKNYTLPTTNAWFDVLSEVNGSGTLTQVVSATVSVPAYDARFYLKQT